MIFVRAPRFAICSVDEIPMSVSFWMRNGTWLIRLLESNVSMQTLQSRTLGVCRSVLVLNCAGDPESGRGPSMFKTHSAIVQTCSKMV